MLEVSNLVGLYLEYSNQMLLNTDPYFMVSVEHVGRMVKPCHVIFQIFLGLSRIIAKKPSEVIFLEYLCLKNNFLIHIYELNLLF